MTIYAQPVNQYNTTVLSMWEKLVPRLDLTKYSVSFLDSCQEVIEIISEHLWFRKSDLLKNEYQYSLVAGTDSVDLPPEFLAMEYFPYMINPLNNEIVNLSNLHPSRLHDYTANDKPKYYELNNMTLKIYAPADTNYDLFVRVYTKPPALITMNDTIPFNGLFNQLIGDYAVRISNLGLGLLADPTFMASVTAKIDKMINLRNTKNIYWKQTRTSRQYLYNNINPDYF